ncbi:TspO/MBR family protein [uncultured archaeon]|nr:TspO/MBR family protein [uncultured archaeon]
MAEISQILLYVIICEAAGLIGGIFTSRSIPSWYKKLKKPKINPPSWIFGPVWTILYALMGVSIAIVLSINSGFFIAQKFGIMLFWTQLGLNILWSIIFFGMKKPGLAFLEIILLWIAIVATIYEFFFVSSTAAGLLVPYLLWVSFASVLNFLIWRLNRK